MNIFLVAKRILFGAFGGSNIEIRSFLSIRKRLSFSSLSFWQPVHHSTWILYSTNQKRLFKDIRAITSTKNFHFGVKLSRLAFSPKVSETSLFYLFRSIWRFSYLNYIWSETILKKSFKKKLVFYIRVWLQSPGSQTELFDRFFLARRTWNLGLLR